jgi:hypothetical protein
MKRKRLKNSWSGSRTTTRALSHHPLLISFLSTPSGLKHTMTEELELVENEGKKTAEEQ